MVNFQESAKRLFSDNTKTQWCRGYRTTNDLNQVDDDPGFWRQISVVDLQCRVSTTVITGQGLEYWRSLRKRLRRQWWAYLVVAVIGTFWFVHSLPPREPVGFAVLLLIPIISLRQAWKVDRQIVACNAQIADAVTINGESHE